MAIIQSQLNKSKILSNNTTSAIFLLTAIFLSSLGTLVLIYLSFPELNKSDAQHIKFPQNIEEAKSLALTLSNYKDQYYMQVLTGLAVTYLFLQTFAIPGSIFLSIILGFLFPFYTALVVICFCSATGALLCYLLSHLVGKYLIYKYLPLKINEWSRQLDKHRDNMFFYIMFLRITPFLPNWFINIASPILEINIIPFWFGTFFGVAPPSMIAIKLSILSSNKLKEKKSKLEALLQNEFIR